MFVCICNTVTDQEIQQAVNDGVRQISELKEQLGVANCCGQCLDCAHKVLKEAIITSNLPLA